MSFFSQREAEFVKRLFEKYYRSNSGSIYVPKMVERREFGYFSFGQRVMVRHLSYQSGEELRVSIARVTPLHVYRSAAYYRYPKAPMEEKDWLGADLIFDIDADHLGLRCVSEHTYLICSKCGLTDVEGGRCSNCGSEVRKVEWVCDDCLKAAKSELMKLIDILLDDLGVGEEEIEVGFSGNRGYHIAVYSENFSKLDQMARRELVGYLTATGLEPRLHEIPTSSSKSRGRPKGVDYPEPRLDSWGWRGRVIRRIYRALMSRDEVFERASSRLSASELERVAEVWLNEPTWGAASPKAWKVLAEEAANAEAARIDPVVTADLHRLIRLSSTLNGKTGLLAKLIPLQDVDTFEPLRDAVALDDDGGMVRLMVFYSPAFKLGDDFFDEVEGPSEVEMPKHAAAYLMCKGLARLI